MITATTLEDVTKIGSTDLVFDLDSAYTKTLMAQPRDDRGGVFHPSAIGMCGRRNVYEYLRYEQEQNNDEQSLERFRIGHKVHELVQEMMEAMRPVYAEQGITLKFRREYPMRQFNAVLLDEFGTDGTCDGLLEIECEARGWKQRGILEVKSIKDEDWKNLKGPKKDHREQASIYAYAFDAPIMWFWYYNKNNSLRKVFTEVFDPLVFNEVLGRIGGWLDFARRSELPEREETYFGCPRCGFKKHCNPPILAKIRSRSAPVRGFGGRR